jgi:predicted nucleic acid-binding protein
MRDLIEQGERLALSTLVLYEWLRGPRTREELRAQEALFPGTEAVPFGAREAAFAADAYRKMRRPSGREIDLAIGACAIAHGAALWTLNRVDFADIVGLGLVD